MILGINWYREFPEGLYTFEFFKFKRSPGGMADHPPELVTSVSVADSNKLKSELLNLLEKHNQTSIFFKQNGNNALIEISWYHLYDYDFLFALEVEKLLRQENAKQVEVSYKESELQKLGNFDFHQKHYYPKSNYLKIVHAGPKYRNACLNFISATCNMSSNKVESFIKEVKLLANECGIFSFYYSEKSIESKSNLVLYLTNGRQGIDLIKMTVVDIKRFEMGFERLAELYKVEEGIIGNWENHPSGIKEIVCIDDKEYHPIFSK